MKKKKLLIIIIAGAILVLGIGITGTFFAVKAILEKQSPVLAGDSGSSDTEGSSFADEALELANSADAYNTTSNNAVSAAMETGQLSENATEYEGRKGTGEYNYGEALQKALLFYELQRSGDLPENTRCNWRGDSALNDGQDVGLDLTGGLYDAGDNVKFNLPMAYTASFLAWSVYEDKDSYEESGQLPYIMDSIRWINDYLIKCHPKDNVFYYQVGDGGADHSWWGPSEVMPMERPSFMVDQSNPGSTPVAQAAASLAACSIVFKESDPTYSKLCLEHARQLFDFADATKSDAGYTASNGYYTSHSGFYDELTWAGSWLYLATKEEKYLTLAEEYFKQSDTNYKWTMCWDNVSLGAAILLARQTKDTCYTQFLQNNLDYWTTGVNGERITYTPKGLAWLDSWGSLRYATTESFIALLYSEMDVCPKERKEVYKEFALSQMNYALGSTGFSYEIGFGDSYPQNPHHRTAQGSYANNMNEPAIARHTLYGALVGGPDSNDGYTDEVSNYTNNEVACDYNAGFVASLAKLYKTYGGQTLVNFGAVEDADIDEIYVEAGINTSGANFMEVKAFVTNVSAWPARGLKQASLRYFVDLSELYEAGGTASDISVNTNYSQGGSASGILPWDEENHIYYVEIHFGEDGIYPGGQGMYRKEVQFRLTSASVWDNSNDFSYQELDGTNANALVVASHMALYEGNTLVFGEEPDGEKIPTHHTNVGNAQSPNAGNDLNVGTVPSNNAVNSATDSMSNDDLKVSISQNSSGGTISFTLDIQNTGKAAIALSDLSALYYFTPDSEAALSFWCDYSCISGSSYTAVTSNVKGTFSDSGSKDATASRQLLIYNDSTEKLQPQDTWSIQIRVAKSDWSNFTFTNDYSAKEIEKVVILKKSEVTLGKKP